MSWLRASRGRGVRAGLYRRPSSILLILAFASFVLQLIPNVGFILMFFGGPAWTGLLVELALVAMAVEALLGYLPRAFIAIPAAAILGYYGALLAERAALTANGIAWASENDVGVAVFDPATSDILLDYRNGVLDARDEAALLIDRYGLPQVYAAAYDGGDGVDRIVSWGAESCPEGMIARSATPGFTATPGIDRAIRICIEENAQPSDRTLYRVTRRVEPPPGMSGGSDSTKQYTLRLDGTTLGTYTTVTARTLAWIPWMALGCGAVDNTGRWGCRINFSKTELILDTTPPNQPAKNPVAVMLGLTPTY